jgi:hypothetical protein
MSLKQLQTLLEGKTISKIEEPGAAEAICKFVLSDGSAFRLHATELGFWIEETEGADGYYPSLHALAIDYGHHMHNHMPYYNYNPPDAEIEIKDDILSRGHKIIAAISPKNKIFLIRSCDLSDTENNILNNNKAIRVLKNSLCMGEMWRSQFLSSQAEDLPENCILK